MLIPKCANPRCREDLLLNEGIPLCASCKLMGGWAFVIGGVIAGALVRFFG